MTTEFSSQVEIYVPEGNFYRMADVQCEVTDGELSGVFEESADVFDQLDKEDRRRLKNEAFAADEEESAKADLDRELAGRGG